MNNPVCRRILAFSYYFVVVAAACLYTLLDWFLITLYFTYLLPAIILLSLPIVLYSIEPKRSRTIALGLLVVWLLAMPYIRWDYYKGFFIDARRIHPGMTLVEAQSIMEPYYSYADSTNSKAIRFKPFEGGGSQCIVFVEENKVKSVRILVD